MNYWDRHIGDIIRDTVSLTMLEDGAYNRLLDQYYQTERPLPLDRKMVYRLARATSAQERKAVDFVLQAFFRQDADGYHQKRCDEEIARFKEKQRKAQASANARWSKSDGNAIVDANASPSHDAPDMRTHCEGNAHQTPNTKHHKKDTRVPRFDAQAHLESMGVDPSVARDWLALRKGKRLTPTLTAFDGVKAEADRAGMSLNEALKVCCLRGWGGFKADWMTGAGQFNGRAAGGPDSIFG